MNIHLTGVSSLVEAEAEGKQRFQSFTSASSENVPFRFHITASQEKLRTGQSSEGTGMPDSPIYLRTSRSNI